MACVSEELKGMDCVLGEQRAQSVSQRNQRAWSVSQRNQRAWYVSWGTKGHGLSSGTKWYVLTFHSVHLSEFVRTFCFV